MAVLTAQVLPTWAQTDDNFLFILRSKNKVVVSCVCHGRKWAQSPKKTVRHHLPLQASYCEKDCSLPKWVWKYSNGPATELVVMTLECTAEESSGRCLRQATYIRHNFISKIAWLMLMTKSFPACLPLCSQFLSHYMHCHCAELKFSVTSQCLCHLLKCLSIASCLVWTKVN